MKMAKKTESKPSKAPKTKKVKAEPKPMTESEKLRKFEKDLYDDIREGILKSVESIKFIVENDFDKAYAAEYWNDIENEILKDMENKLYING
jgi:uncharacterized membrane-anchored protein YjiN (DUF445 family)